MTKDNQDSLPYQEMLAILENKINSLAKNDLTLEESLKIYEEATEIFVRCDKRLKEAEAKLTRIKEDADGRLLKEPFSLEAEE